MNLTQGSVQIIGHYLRQLPRVPPPWLTVFFYMHLGSLRYLSMAASQEGWWLMDSSRAVFYSCLPCPQEKSANRLSINYPLNFVKVLLPATFQLQAGVSAQSPWQLLSQDGDGQAKLRGPALLSPPLKNIFQVYVHGYFVCMYVCEPCVPGALRDQKGSLYPL